MNNMSVEQIKNYLFQSNDLSILDNKDIKNKIINSENKYQFIWFCQDNRLSDEVYKRLFDDEGIDILINSSDIRDRLNGILTCNRKFASDLLCNDSVCEVTFKYIDSLSSYFDSINEEAAVYFSNYLLERDKGNFLMVFSSYNAEAQFKVIKECFIDDALFKDILSRLRSNALQMVLDDGLITSLADYNFNIIYSLACKNALFPISFLDDKKFITNISNMEDTKSYRFLINKLQISNDVSLLEKKRKEYIDNQIEIYDYDNDMLKVYSDFYGEIACLDEDKRLDSCFDILDRYFNSFGFEQIKNDLGYKLYEILSKRGLTGLKDYLQNKSKLSLSNMIIDYHFEDVPFNVLIDLKELVKFQYTEGRILSDEDIKLYLSVCDIDNSSTEKIFQIHNTLKQFNMKEKFYDDIRASKDKSYQMINDKVLNKQNIIKFYDEEVSNEYGVPIYTLDGDDFMVVVKSLPASKEYILNTIDSYADGSSFSIDGSDKLCTYKDPHDCYNLVYCSLPKNQIVHVYPVDSFSKYNRGKGNGTDRINKIYTPDELVNVSYHYNELIVATPNNTINSELDKKLESPELLAIYCYDNITMNDIESAKRNNCGIIVVKTDKYKIDKTNKLNMFDTTFSFDGYKKGLNYITNIREDNDYGRGR